MEFETQKQSALNTLKNLNSVTDTMLNNDPVLRRNEFNQLKYELSKLIGNFQKQVGICVEDKQGFGPTPDHIKDRKETMLLDPNKPVGFEDLRVSLDWRTGHVISDEQTFCIRELYTTVAGVDGPEFKLEMDEPDDMRRMIALVKRTLIRLKGGPIRPGAEGNKARSFVDGLISFHIGPRVGGNVMSATPGYSRSKFIAVYQMVADTKVTIGDTRYLKMAVDKCVDKRMLGAIEVFKLNPFVGEVQSQHDIDDWEKLRSKIMSLTIINAFSINEADDMIVWLKSEGKAEADIGMRIA